MVLNYILVGCPCIIAAYTNTSTISSTIVSFVGSEVRNYQTMKVKLKGKLRRENTFTLC